MGKQLKLLDEIIESIDKIKQELPEVMTAHDAFNNEVYKDGALSHKIKRLIALSTALRAGCPACIIYQTKMAAEDGATKAEVMEATAVAMAMGGTTTDAWSWMVVKVLEEMGKW